MTNQVKTVLLLGVLSAVLVAFGGMLGPGYLYFSTGLAVFVNLGAYFFSDRIVLAMRQAREVAPDDAPRLHAVVEELAIRAELPKPRVFVIDEAGARISGDQEALARALEKLAKSAERVPGEAQPAMASLFIVYPLAGVGGVLRLFSTHPPIEERVRRLRAMAAGTWRQVA